MIYTTLHNRWLRLVGAVFGELICALAAIFFIVPHGLYTGGIMGVCQLFRSFLSARLGLRFGGYDIAGILYFAVNIPILLYAYKVLGVRLVLRALICTGAYSLFYSAIPVPALPVLEDTLTSCLIGGILSGVGSGIALTCGGAGGGLDVLGLCFAAKGRGVSVGKFSLGFNAVLYLICFLLYNAEVVVYSVIYNFLTAMVIDKVHKQNVNVQTLDGLHYREDRPQRHPLGERGRLYGRAGPRPLHLPLQVRDRRAPGGHPERGPGGLRGGGGGRPHFRKLPQASAIACGRMETGEIRSLFSARPDCN